MKKVKSILKAICIILILGTIMPITANASDTINLGIDKFRGKDSDNTYPSYALQNQYTYKIYESVEEQPIMIKQYIVWTFQEDFEPIIN